MKRRVLKTVMRMLPIAAGLMLAGSQLYAQDGSCCAQTETVMRTCNNAPCHGTVTFRGCAQPEGLNAVRYKVFVVKCCNEDEGTSFNVQVGGDCAAVATASNSGFSLKPRSLFKTVSSSTTVANSIVDDSHSNEGVWVRTCPKKYVFIVPPKPS